MMSKTHLTVGMADALAFTSINTPAECAIAIAGGAIGGVLADVDTLDNDYHADALIGELLAFGTLGIVFVLDHFFKWGICNSIAGKIANKVFMWLGFIATLVLFIYRVLVIMSLI